MKWERGEFEVRLDNTSIPFLVAGDVLVYMGKPAYGVHRFGGQFVVTHIGTGFRFRPRWKSKKRAKALAERLIIEVNGLQKLTCPEAVRRHEAVIKQILEEEVALDAHPGRVVDLNGP